MSLRLIGLLSIRAGVRVLQSNSSKEEEVGQVPSAVRHKGLELMEFCRWEVDGASCSSQPLSVHAEELWFKVTGLKAEDDVLVKRRTTTLHNQHALAMNSS
ncbi:unnamed protein product [Leuciscus chuanchicus]